MTGFLLLLYFFSSFLFPFLHPIHLSYIYTSPLYAPGKRKGGRETFHPPHTLMFTMCSIDCGAHLLRHKGHSGCSLHHANTHFQQKTWPHGVTAGFFRELMHKAHFFSIPSSLPPSLTWSISMLFPLLLWPKAAAPEGTRASVIKVRV